MSRLKRKDIKRDELLESVGRTFSFVHEHNRGLLGAVIAVVVAVVLVAAFFVYRGHRSEQANRLLAAALRIYSAPIDALNPRPDDDKAPAFADEASRSAAAKAAFEQLRSDFKATPIGAIAAAYAGDLAAASGDLDAAQTRWRDAMAESEGTLLAGRLQMSLINLSKGRGEYEAVIEELRGFLSSNKSGLPEDVVLFELAGALAQAGRPDEARATYDRLIEERGTSVYAAEARLKLDQL